MVVCMCVIYVCQKSIYTKNSVQVKFGESKYNSRSVHSYRYNCEGKSRPIS